MTENAIIVISLWIQWDIYHYFFLPNTVENISIRINPQHDVLHGCIMDKRTLRVDKKHIWNPDFLHQTCIEGPTLVAAGGEGQAIILPVMPQVESHGEVLQKKNKKKPVIFNRESKSVSFD